MLVDYSKYERICQEAVRSQEMYDNFKRHPIYTNMLEHVTYQYGLDYLEEIKKDNPFLLQHIDRFATNDHIGNPNIFWYKELNRNLSPTTLRYIKVLSDLLRLFGDMDNMDIVEVGVGYGGQCKIISDIVRFKSYTLVDLPYVLSLASKCLHHQQVKNFIQRGTTDKSEVKYDLFISDYAFTEIERKHQEFYADKIIKNSDRGYITCNYFGSFNSVEALSKEEVLALKPHHVILPEKPLTAPNNLIYTWDKI